MNNPIAPEDIFPYIKLVNSQQLRISIESQRCDIPGLNNRLYSIPSIEPFEITSTEMEKDEMSGKINKNEVKTFNFYLQWEEKNTNELIGKFVEVVKKAVKEKNILILGKRASQGLNTFVFSKYEEVDINYNKNEEVLTMGMLLPNKIDFGKATLKLFTSRRTPFEVVGGWGNREYQFVSFIAPGSVLTISESVNDIAKSIQSPYAPNRSIVFGNGFLYPIQTNQ